MMPYFERLCLCKNGYCALFNLSYDKLFIYDENIKIGAINMKCSLFQLCKTLQLFFFFVVFLNTEKEFYSLFLASLKS